jgi:hypothetical protein
MAKAKNQTPSIGERLFSDDHYLNTLRGFLATGQKPTKARFDAWPDRLCVAASIARRFGSWPEALCRVGISQPHRRIYSGEELVARLELAWRRLGRAPGRVTLERLGNISRKPYVERWGSVRLACRAVDPYRKGHITREDLMRGRTRRRSRSLRPRVRYRVLQRDGFRCVLCGASPATDPKVHLEIDHLVPVSKGGDSTLTNLRTTCRACNRGKWTDHKPGCHG